MTASAGPVRPVVSVIVPSYNDAAMLRRCLDALAAQTRPADEVIVVDNASTDDTPAVARDAGARLVHQPLRGIFPATAAGFDAARGDLLGRLDADSVPPPDWVASVVAAFEQDETLDVLSGPGRFYGSTRAVHWIAEHLYIGAYRRVVGTMLGHPVLFGSNLALRRATWLAVRSRTHQTRADVHDDLDLTINLPPMTHIRFDPHLVVGVSARPFDNAAGLARRVRMAFRTFAVDFAEQSLWSRRREWRRERGRRAQRLVISSKNATRSRASS